MTNNERAFQTQLQRSVELTLCGKISFHPVIFIKKSASFLVGCYVYKVTNTDPSVSIREASTGM